MQPLFSIFILAGLGATLIGLWLLRRTWAFKRTALTAQGHYVAATWRTASVKRRTAYPVVEFQTTAGQADQFESRVGDAVRQQRD